MAGWTATDRDDGHEVCWDGNIRAKGKLKGEQAFFSSFTKGSILFAGDEGEIKQDNANLFWDDTNNRLGLGTTTPATALDVGGHIILQEAGDGRAAPSDTDPHLRVYSSDATNADDYFEMFHDGTNAILTNGTGNMNVESAGNFNLDSEFGQFQYRRSGTDVFFIQAQTVLNHFNFAVGDVVGNMFILTNLANRARDHDHATQTNPTMFFHSDTDPNTANDEWVSITHDQTNAVLQLGSGAYTFLDGDMGIRTSAPVTTLDVNGGLALNTVTKTGAYTLTTSDSTVRGNITGDNFTLTLPAASGVTGITYRIKKVSTSGALTVAADGSDTIEEAATAVLNTKGESIDLQALGTNWDIL